ncbi:hypothetical protein FQA39_LY04402 [Lamprigera yunnana]|nr:hypothetical protein FQA39_LY04402 [Lamprigera yunnana]
MMFRRVFVVLTILILSVAGKKIDDKILQKWQELIFPHQIHCIKESNVQREDIDQFVKFGEVSDIASYGCYLKCLYEKLNFLDVNKQFDRKVIKSTFFYIDENLTDKCIKEFADEKDLCRKSYFESPYYQEFLLDFTINMMFRIVFVVLTVLTPSVSCKKIDNKMLQRWQELISPHQTHCIKESNVESEDIDELVKLGEILYTPTLLHLLDVNKQFDRKVIIMLTILTLNVSCKKIDKKILDRWHELISPHQIHCIKESNVQREDIDQLVKLGEISDTPSNGCYLKCLYEKLNLLDVNKQFDRKVIRSKFFYVDEKLADKCIKEVADEKDLCRKSYLMGRCVIKAV